MSTLALMSAFSELAHADHIKRLEDLLAQLDPGGLFSHQPEFRQHIQQGVLLLARQGIRRPYLQACLLYCRFHTNVQLDSMPTGASHSGWIHALVQQALLLGAKPADFACLHQNLAQIRQFDGVWVSTEPEPDELVGALIAPVGLLKIELACNSEGLVEPEAGVLLNEDVTHFKADCGFQHAVFDQFRPLALLQQVCRQRIPSEPLQMSLQPRVANCETGLFHAGVFQPCQTLALFDARKLDVNVLQHGLTCPVETNQRLEANWQQKGKPGDKKVELAPQLIQADCSLQAGWEKQADVFSFKLEGNACFELPAGAVKWEASMQHEGCQLQLTIQPDSTEKIHWPLSAQWPEGLLPLGDDLLAYQQRLPLQVEMVSVVQVGQPILGLQNMLAGHLLLDFLVRLNPENRQLELMLSLSHSELCLSWQKADPLHGWSAGCFSLLAPAKIASWNLLNG